MLGNQARIAAETAVAPQAAFLTNLQTQSVQYGWTNGVRANGEPAVYVEAASVSRPGRCLASFTLADTLIECAGPSGYWQRRMESTPNYC